MAAPSAVPTHATSCSLANHGSLDEQEAIVEAILAGEAEQVERLLKVHTNVRGEEFTDGIAMFPMPACNR